MFKINKTVSSSLNRFNDMEKIGEYLSVFPWREFPKKDGEELYCGLVYVYCLFKERLLNLPLDVLKSESPDFLLSFSGSSVGLEVTIATTRSYSHAKAVADKEFPECPLVEMSGYDSNTTSKETVRKGFWKSGEKSPREGLGDYGKEKLWIKCIEHSIKKKTELLNKPHFKKFEANELIINDDTPTVGPRLDYAIPRLNKIYQEQIKTCEFETFFDKTHVITNHLLIYDLFGNCQKFDIPKSRI